MHISFFKGGELAICLDFGLGDFCLAFKIFRNRKRVIFQVPERMQVALVKPALGTWREAEVRWLGCDTLLSAVQGRMGLTD